jgi:hypothetical protein
VHDLADRGDGRGALRNGRLLLWLLLTAAAGGKRGDEDKGAGHKQPTEFAHLRSFHDTRGVQHAPKGEFTSVQPPEPRRRSVYAALRAVSSEFSVRKTRRASGSLDSEIFRTLVSVPWDFMQQP